ncbi:hypothetical protein CEP52_013285 [Fusarium oligoseptatum]|uniref:Uncharacterized protein n=1 Tax=Fusarium oligoseptatum TaxID=2604345 RepID=A0A428SUP9_9HYPO|nr:hypothetical protein CEP52_013285 [Fusarium oligoseptatum]
MRTIEPYCTVYNKHFSHVLFQHNGIVRTDGRKRNRYSGTFGASFGERRVLKKKYSRFVMPTVPAELVRSLQ